MNSLLFSTEEASTKMQDTDETYKAKLRYSEAANEADLVMSK